MLCSLCSDTTYMYNLHRLSLRVQLFFDSWLIFKIPPKLEGANWVVLGMNISKLWDPPPPIVILGEKQAFRRAPSQEKNGCSNFSLRWFGVFQCHVNPESICTNLIPMCVHTGHEFPSTWNSVCQQRGFTSYKEYTFRATSVAVWARINTVFM